jgi:hypothetical protein
MPSSTKPPIRTARLRRRRPASSAPTPETAQNALSRSWPRWRSSSRPLAVSNPVPSGWNAVTIATEPRYTSDAAPTLASASRSLRRAAGSTRDIASEAAATEASAIAASLRFSTP